MLIEINETEKEQLTPTELNVINWLNEHENNIYDFRIIDELVYEQTELINPYTAETS